MSGGVLTFGSYTFPATLAEFSDNFKDTTPQTVRLPGMDGGYNQDGDKTSNTAIGKVTVGFWLVAQSRAAMDDLRDAVGAMVEYGYQQLTYQPTDPADAVRFCWARVNYIGDSERKDEHTDLHQKVSITFQVPDPRWYVGTALPWRLGDGHQIGDVGLTIGGGGTPETTVAAGTLTSDTITNNGNTTAIATVAIICGAAETCQNPIVRRRKNGEIVDEFQYLGTIGNNGELYVSGRLQRASLDGDNIIGNLFTYEHPDFLRLEPGANTIEILFSNAGDDATVYYWFATPYR